MSITVATINVNGIRAAFSKGFQQWLESRQPDILLLQETRAPAEVVASFFPDDEWHVAVNESREKGRAGVAIASRQPINAVRSGIPGDDAETPRDSGRWLEADLIVPGAQNLTVVSTYLHSATNTEEKAHTLVEKYSHLDRVDKRLQEMIDLEHPVIVGGDFNIAHHNRDIANWKGNLKSAGFLPAEREYLTRWFGDYGWVDLGRHHAGEVEGPYTWWSWRGQAFTNDRGWRIDYQAANPAAARAARSVLHDRQPTYEQRYSDHAPVIATFELERPPRTEC